MGGGGTRKGDMTNSWVGQEATASEKKRGTMRPGGCALQLSLELMLFWAANLAFCGLAQRPGFCCSNLRAAYDKLEAKLGQLLL